MADIIHEKQELIADYAQKYHDEHPGEPVKIGFLPASVWSVFEYAMDYDFAYGERFYDLTWNNGHSSCTRRNIRQEDRIGDAVCVIAERGMKFQKYT